MALTSVGWKVCSVYFSHLPTHFLIRHFDRSFPDQVISLVCLCLSMILLAIALISTYWLKTYSFHTGLFQECTEPGAMGMSNPVPFAPPEGQCQQPQRNTGEPTEGF